MPFGIGPIEILVLMVLFLGVPSGIAFLLIRAVLRSRRSSRVVVEQQRQHQQLAAELDAAQLRLEDLEDKLARAEEQARFAESLLDRRPERG
jgi:cell division protein FtsB